LRGRKKDLPLVVNVKTYRLRHRNALSNAAIKLLDSRAPLIRPIDRGPPNIQTALTAREAIPRQAGRDEKGISRGLDALVVTPLQASQGEKGEAAIRLEHHDEKERAVILQAQDEKGLAVTLQVHDEKATLLPYQDLLYQVKRLMANLENPILRETFLSRPKKMAKRQLSKNSASISLRKKRAKAKRHLTHAIDKDCAMSSTSRDGEKNAPLIKCALFSKKKSSDLKS
jgi:hypothetical protein